MSVSYQSSQDGDFFEKAIIILNISPILVEYITVIVRFYQSTVKIHSCWRSIVVKSDLSLISKYKAASYFISELNTRYSNIVNIQYCSTYICMYLGMLMYISWSLRCVQNRAVTTIPAVDIFTIMMSVQINLCKRVMLLIVWSNIFFNSWSKIILCVPMPIMNKASFIH